MPLIVEQVDDENAVGIGEVELVVVEGEGGSVEGGGDVDGLELVGDFLEVGEFADL